MSETEKVCVSKEKERGSTISVLVIINIGNIGLVTILHWPWITY